MQQLITHYRSKAPISALSLILLLLLCCIKVKLLVSQLFLEQHCIHMESGRRQTEDAHWTERQDSRNNTQVTIRCYGDVVLFTANWTKYNSKLFWIILCNYHSYECSYNIMLSAQTTCHMSQNIPALYQTMIIKFQVSPHQNDEVVIDITYNAMISPYVWELHQIRS